MKWRHKSNFFHRVFSDYNQAINSPEACRKRLLKYVVPVIILSFSFNIPKFMEARVRIYTANGENIINESDKLVCAQELFTRPRLAPPKQDIISICRWDFPRCLVIAEIYLLSYQCTCPRTTRCFQPGSFQPVAIFLGRTNWCKCAKMKSFQTNNLTGARPSDGCQQHLRL